MTSSRDQILGKLRAARRPFPNAAARPDTYIPVIPVQEDTPLALAERFIQEMALLKGQAFLVADDAAVRQQVLELLQKHGVDHLLAWDFTYIPVDGLQAALEQAGIRVTIPQLHESRSPDIMGVLDSAGAGLSGADAAVAMTGTLILSSGTGKGRIPTVLPPVWIAVVTLAQLVPRIEDWLAGERGRQMQTVYERSNVAFVTGPSRTGDIEMELILGVHGPGTQYVIIKQS
jgi:L-lactate utilization protein LutC